MMRTRMLGLALDLRRAELAVFQRAALSWPSSADGRLAAHPARWAESVTGLHSCLQAARHMPEVALLGLAEAKPPKRARQP